MPAKLPAALPTDRKKCSQILLAMKLSQYGYDFSADLLAKYPAENRDESRLMVVNRAKGTIEHLIFK